MEDNNTKYTCFCAEEKPQYKAYNNGYEALTVVELISMIIGTGTKRNVEQARQIYNMMEGKLRNIAKARVEDLQVVQGIGDSKAIALQAAIELGKRYNQEKIVERPTIDNSLAIYDFIHPKVRDLDVEEAHLLLMNQNFKLIKNVKLSEGGITETAIDVRRVMREAVMNNSTILALVHNHPSDNPQPSKADNILTQQVKDACKIMNIFFMDHVIVGDECFYSYHDRGQIV